MTFASIFAPRSWNPGMAWFTPVSIPDLNIRYPNGGFGQGTGTDTVSAVEHSLLCTVAGLWCPFPPAGDGRFSLENHAGTKVYFALKLRAAQGANVYFRFGSRGVLVPAFRVKWAADTPGNAGPVGFSVFYKDFTERDTA